MNSTKTIHSANNAGLYLFQDEKIKKILKNIPIPSVEEFSTEINTILSQNSLTLLHNNKDIAYWRRPGGFQKAKELEAANAAERLRYATSCMNQFFTNPIITRYLARREVAVSELGIPLYTKAERTLYDFEHMPYISLRNPNLKNCPAEIGLFGWGIDYKYAEDWQKEYSKPYTKLAEAIFGYPQYNARIEIPNYNAFNFLGAEGSDLKLILAKNKARIEKQKNIHFGASGFEGIHYLDYLSDFSKIVQLVESIQMGRIVLEATRRNIFIFSLDDSDGHDLCGLLVIHSEDIHNPIVSELFLFDSEAHEVTDDNDYVLYLENTLKNALGNRPAIKLTYICYNVQSNGVDGFEGYELDCNCSFYSIRLANKLVEVIGSSEGSVLRDRIMGCKGSEQCDTQEDIAIYVHEVAKLLPDLFDYHSESGTYVAKSFKERQVYNVAARWEIGRKFLKHYIRQYALDHQLPTPIFKVVV